MTEELEKKLYKMELDRDYYRAEVEVLMQKESLRDMFAAKALQGIMSNDDLLKGSINGSSDIKVKAAISKDAYELADAMLAARETKEAK